uniref:PIF1/LRR1 pleckstrin homology domain-containing protein n=1 Tax=Microcebus murinus TaxID=30608 RepID=A0A8C5Y9C7_MICMU
MKLHCKVEVVSRHLPALGLRNWGKAVLSLCQQRPTSYQQPICLLISTLKDKHGTPYEAGHSGSCQ